MGTREKAGYNSHSIYCNYSQSNFRCGGGWSNDKIEAVSRGRSTRIRENEREREREDLTSSCETRRCKSLDFTGNSRRNDVSFLKGISTGTNGYAAHGRLLNFKRSSFLFREGGDASLHQSRLRPSSWPIPNFSAFVRISHGKVRPKLLVAFES